ncbi:hypothetical protein [Planococcus dechangensis]|uniref:DUF4825 domain-containing protein n=1 Tax=Planococcus dechangensis TaxID=1176255 RepID=A0ABV9MCA9_9BACL
MRRKWLARAVLILFLGACAVWYTNWQYPIRDDESAVQLGLNEWHRDTAATPEVFNVISTTQLGESSSHIILYETTSNVIGYARMIKGWNGQFKITESGWGQNVSYHGIQTNHGIYGMLIGTNPGLRLDHVTVESTDADFRFTSELPQEYVFLVYEKLPDSVNSAFPADFTFFDEAGEEIEPVLE